MIDPGTINRLMLFVHKILERNDSKLDETQGKSKQDNGALIHYIERATYSGAVICENAHSRQV